MKSNRVLVAFVALGVVVVVGMLLWSNRSREITPRPSPRATEARWERVAQPPAKRDPIARIPQQNEEHLAAVIRGRVLSGANGINEATVFARISPQEGSGSAIAYPDGVLAVALTSISGEYVLALPQRSVSYNVDVGACANGYVRKVVEDVRIEPNSPVKVDIELEAGLSISGKLVDSEGRAIQGCLIMASTKPGIGVVTSNLMSPYLLDTEELRLARRGSDYSEGRSLTGEGGYFEIGGLSAGRHSIISLDYGYMVHPAVQCEAGVADVLVVAVRPVGVKGSIVDMSSNLPIQRCFVKVSPEDGSYIRSGTSLGGEISLAWRGMGLVRSLKAMVTITAAGYDSWSEVVDLDPERGISDLGVVKLSPRPKGRVSLVVRYDDGSPFRGSLRLEYGESGGGVSGKVELTMKEPGLYVGSVPTGSWFVRARPDGWMGGCMEWRSEMSVGDEGVWYASATLPKGATLIVRRPDEAGMWALLASGPKFTSSIEISDLERRFEDFPCGEWDLVLSRDGKQVTRRHVSLRSGDTYEFDER